MEIKAKFDHYNCNVLDLEKSLAFYNKALGFEIHCQIKAADDSYIIEYPEGYWIEILPVK